MSMEINSGMTRTTAALAMVFAFTSCQHTKQFQNLTPDEQFCHDQAAKQTTLKNTATEAAMGAGAGAVTGAVIPGVSVLEGAGVGALLGAGQRMARDEMAYTEEYNRCMAEMRSRQGGYGVDQQRRYEVPPPNGAKHKTLPAGTGKRTAPAPAMPMPR